MVLGVALHCVVGLVAFQYFMVFMVPVCPLLGHIHVQWAVIHVD